eukprot:TRINITY_DN3528_c0_g6_i1.p3 TRINITY_DN3528_c0_g6~~TRINITY_DN3528_c0_g6_i1.p3  ORF type:complete len:50 (-),score=11.47 TRINITY_DN3528_c0_g6_i1:13-162(-)
MYLLTAKKDIDSPHDDDDKKGSKWVNPVRKGMSLITFKANSKSQESLSN